MDFVIGQQAGIVIWLILFSIIQEINPLNSLNLPINISVVIAMATTFGVLSTIKREIFLIFATSISGAYQVSKVTMLNKKLFAFSWQIYMYLSLIVLFTVVSFLF